MNTCLPCHGVENDEHQSYWKGGLEGLVGVEPVSANSDAFAADIQKK